MKPSKLQIPPLVFSSGSIDNQTFDKQYSEKGWLGRKIVALPAALWTGLIQSTYNLFCYNLILSLGLCKSILYSRRFEIPLKVKSYAMVHHFYALRNLQESFGWLISLFNDRSGQFRVQSSRSHKKYYDSYIKETSLIFKCNKSLRKQEKLIQETQAEEELLIQMAEDYYKKGNLLQRINIYCRMAFNLPDRDVLLEKISQTYLKIGNLYAHDHILQRRGFDSQDRENLYKDIIKQHLNSKNWAEAESIIYHLHNPRLREKCLASLIKSLSLTDDAEDFFIHIMLNYCHKSMISINRDYMKILGDHPDGVKRVVDFLFSIAESFYAEIKEHFERKEFKIITQKMALKVKDASVRDNVWKFMEDLSAESYPNKLKNEN